MGFPLEDGHFLVWDENWETFQIFIAIRTQWRTGASGYTGLDYPAVRGELKEMGHSRKDRNRHMAKLKAMETTILNAWTEERSNAK